METQIAQPSPPEQSQEFLLHAGNLGSIASLHHSLAPQLLQYSKIYMAGGRPRVKLNLTNIQPKKASMSALTALLSTIDRLHEFSGSPTQVKINWIPELFSFWEDIGFFYIGKERGLFEWEEGIVGGFSPGNTNPSTKLLIYPMERDWRTYPAELLSIEELTVQKDAIRNRVKEKLLLLCSDIFRQKHGAQHLPDTLRDQVAITSAELVVNAHLWGKSHAFVGLQRSSRGITVCVCDSGDGFQSSLQKKLKRKFEYTPTSHLEAMAMGCIQNKEDFGLRHAIEIVTKSKGRAEIFSYSAEIVWQADIWEYWLKTIEFRNDAEKFSSALANMRNQFMTKQPGFGEKQIGYWREWETPLRGTRITFEIPFQRI